MLLIYCGSALNRKWRNLQGLPTGFLLVLQAKWDLGAFVSGDSYIG
jgi:hypothetical protein